MKDSAHQARRLNEALDQLLVERVQADDDHLHVTVEGEWLRDLFRQERQRHTALVAALDTLVAKWHRRVVGPQPPGRNAHERAGIMGARGAIEDCADALAATLAKHRGLR